MSKTNEISKEETILFARQLALAIRSDIPLASSLSFIAKRSDNQKLKLVLEDIIDEINVGERFSDAVKKHQGVLTPFFVQMVNIGEESGNLPNVLEQVATSYEKQVETNNKLRQAITYPLILTGLMFGVIILLIVQVMPMFNDVLQSLGGDIPTFTKGILSFSLFIRDHFILLVLIITILVIGITLYTRTQRGMVFKDGLKFKLPVYKGINSSMLATRFARNLGLLIQSGLSYQQALELIKPTMNNIFAQDMISNGVNELNRGKTLEEVIEKMDLFPWILMKLFGLAEKTGQMDKALLTAADEMEKDVEVKMARLSTVVEPVLIIILSLIVGVILVSVVLPVVNIMNSIG